MKFLCSIFGCKPYVTQEGYKNTNYKPETICLRCKNGI